MLSYCRKWCLFAVVLAVPMAVPAPARAQAASGVQALGTAEISHPATLMRMQVIVSAEGKSTAEALQALKGKRDTLKAQLAQLGATADSVKADEPRLLSDSSEQSRRMEQLMRMRMGGSAPKARKERGIKLASTVTAEWPLTGSAEELLIESQDLRKKVEDALKAPAPATDAAAEEQEEQAAELPDFGDNAPKPGEPVILYVAKISADERTKAYASAFEKAKAQATQLAKAANVNLVSLQSLSRSASPNYAYRGGMNAVAYQVLQAMSSGESGQNPDPDEMIGPDPSAIKLQVVVSAGWSITTFPMPPGR